MRTTHVAADSVHLYIVVWLLPSHKQCIMVLPRGDFDRLLRYINEMSARPDVDFSRRDAELWFRKLVLISEKICGVVKKVFFFARLLFKKRTSVVNSNGPGSAAWYRNPYFVQYKQSPRNADLERQINENCSQIDPKRHIYCHHLSRTHRQRKRHHAHIHIHYPTVPRATRCTRPLQGQTRWAVVDDAVGDCEFDGG